MRYKQMPLDFSLPLRLNEWSMAIFRSSTAVLVDYLGDDTFHSSVSDFSNISKFNRLIGVEFAGIGSGINGVLAVDQFGNVSGFGGTHIINHSVSPSELKSGTVFKFLKRAIGAVEDAKYMMVQLQQPCQITPLPEHTLGYTYLKDRGFMKIIDGVPSGHMFLFTPDDRIVRVD